MYNENIYSKISGRDMTDCQILARLRNHPRKDVVVNEHGAFFQGVCIARAKLVKEEEGHGRKLQPTA